MRRIALTLLLTVSASITTARGTEVVHFERLTDLRQASTSAVSRSPGPTVLLAFTAYGQAFSLELEPNAPLRALHRRLALPSDTVAYRGALAGRPGSWVRLVSSPQGLAGIISDGQTLYGLEAPFDSAAATDETIIFRLEDMHIEIGALQCGARFPPATATAMLAHIESDTRTVLAQTGASYRLDIGAVADYEFTEAFGANAEAALLARFNNVDGIFSAQLGVQINVAETALFWAEPDPFSASDSHDLLDELAIFRGNTAAQDAQGLTHLFTGRNLDGTTAGIAYVGALCAQRSAFDPDGRSFGVGLSEGNRGLIVDSLVAAHEIGHNFGAPHDAEAGSVCESTEPIYLMAPAVNGSDQFSQCSIEQMAPEIAAADCLTPIGQADLAVTGPATSPAVGVGETFEYALEILNEGYETATGVTADIELGQGLAWTAATEASCELTDATVSCGLAPIPGNTATTLTLTLSAEAEGELPLSAVSRADLDANAANDIWNDTVTARPFVNLGLTGTGAALIVDAAGSFEIELANQASADATAILLSLDASAGLRIDGASISGGNCTATSQTGGCELTMLMAGSTVTLQLYLTGLTAGAQSVLVTAGGLEPDQNTADNSLRLNIDVRAPAPARTGSGGGSAAALLLILTAGLGCRRGRRSGNR